MPLRIAVDSDAIAEFCKRHRIRRLSFFGSVLRDDFTPESDVDVLVEFEPGHVAGYIRMAGMEAELAVLLGRRVDMVTFAGLHKGFREDVLREVRDAFVAA